MSEDLDRVVQLVQKTNLSRDAGKWQPFAQCELAPRCTQPLPCPWAAQLVQQAAPDSRSCLTAPHRAWSFTAWSFNTGLDTASGSVGYLHRGGLWEGQPWCWSMSNAKELEHRREVSEARPRCAWLAHCTAGLKGACRCQLDAEALEVVMSHVNGGRWQRC